MEKNIEQEMEELSFFQKEIFKQSNQHIIDTHAHYNRNDYDVDRDKLMASFLQYGINRVVNIGADIDSSKESLALADQYEHIYATVGVHPSDISALDEESYQELDRLCTHSKVVAVGEIGFDYYWDDTKKDLQKYWFKKQVELARKHHLPIVIHSRDAAKDTMDAVIEQRVSEIGGVLHCYSYGVEQAKEYVKMGLFIGIGGVCTFKNSKKIKEVIQEIPLENIVLETDAPYLAPAPFRGKRNSSLYLPYIIATIADLKGITDTEVIEQTYQNTFRLYPSMKR